METRDDVDAAHRHYVEQDKPDAKDRTLYDLICAQIKKRQNEH